MNESEDEERQRWLQKATNQEPESLEQNNLAYGALIGVGLIVVQPFMNGGQLGVTGMICVVAFSVAIPLLGALVLVNRHEVLHGRMIRTGIVSVARSSALSCASTGLIAAFWYIHWIAGVGLLAGGLAGAAVFSAGYVHLEQPEDHPSR